MVVEYIRTKPFNQSNRPYQLGYKNGRKAASSEVFSNNPINRQYVKNGKIHEFAQYVFDHKGNRGPQQNYLYPSESDAYYAGFMDGFEFEASRLLGGQRQLGEF